MEQEVKIHDKECISCANLFECSGHPENLKQGGCINFREKKDIKVYRGNSKLPL